MRKLKAVSQQQNRDDEDDKLFRQALATLQNAPDADDNFGAYVAMELKGLRSDFYKRKLKREIRRAVICAIDEEDMAYYAGVLPNSSSPGLVIQSNNESSCIPTPLPSRAKPMGKASSSSCV